MSPGKDERRRAALRLHEQLLPDGAAQPPGPLGALPTRSSRWRRRCRKVDEIPFDFQRKRMSVVVEYEGDHVLICKGAVEDVFKVCSSYQVDDDVLPLIDMIKPDVLEDYGALSADGYRVLAIAYREFPRDKTTFSAADESDLILLGYIAFFDPPKESTAQALQALKDAGVAVKILTGDNDLVTRKICRDVGIDVEHLVTGPQLQGLPPAQLAETARKGHRARPPLPDPEGADHPGPAGQGPRGRVPGRRHQRRAGPQEGRRRASRWTRRWTWPRSRPTSSCWRRACWSWRTASSRAGRSSATSSSTSAWGRARTSATCSAWWAGASSCPSCPCCRSRCSPTTCSTTSRRSASPPTRWTRSSPTVPRKWNIGNIRRFMMLIGPMSSIFDYATFFLMLFFFGCIALHLPLAPARTMKAYYEALFHTGWFVESILTQTLIVHVIRTRKIPFFQSMASPAHALLHDPGHGDRRVPALLPCRAVSSVSFRSRPSTGPGSRGSSSLYCALTHLVKRWFFRKFGVD